MDPSNSDRQSSSSVQAVTGRARGTTSQGRGRGIARDRGCGASIHVTSTISDTDRALPEVAGIWESDEEPLSVLYRYREIPDSTIPFDDNTTAVSLFCKYFTDEVWNLLVIETNCMHRLIFLPCQMPVHGLMSQLKK